MVTVYPFAHFRQLVHVLWDLCGHFNRDTPVQAALNKLLAALGEAAKFQAQLVDQASRAITRNMMSFMKTWVVQKYQVSGKLSSYMYSMVRPFPKLSDLNDMINVFFISFIAATRMTHFLFKRTSHFLWISIAITTNKLATGTNLCSIKHWTSAMKCASFFTIATLFNYSLAFRNFLHLFNIKRVIQNFVLGMDIHIMNC